MAIFYVDKNALGENNGRSWTNSFTDLQDALAIAAPNDEIWVAQGVYKPTNGTNRLAQFSIPTGVEIYGGFAGWETSRQQRNWINNKTVLSGDIGQPGVKTDNSRTIVDITNTTPTTIFDGFTVSDAQSEGFGRAPIRAAGTANGVLRNLIVRDNSNIDGGGLAVAGGQPKLSNIAFINNFASRRGGAINWASRESFVAKNLVFIGNEAQNGGAVSLITTTAKIDNSTFYKNQAEDGSVVKSNLQSNRYNLNIENSIIWNNSRSDNGNQFGTTDSERITINNSIVEGSYTGAGTNIINVDPLFVDPNNNNLRLRSNSPAIDIGDNNVIDTDTDIIDNPRIFNSVVDLGAYEYKPLSFNMNRFQNKDIPGTYLFAGGDESDNIREKFSNFEEEGFAFQVGIEPGDDLIPLYRFQSQTTPGTYLFVGENERNNINANFSESFNEEGLAFYVYQAGSGKGVSFNRFQNTSRPGTYLFASPNESANIEANFPNFNNEGVAFEVDI